MPASCGLHSSSGYAAETGRPSFRSPRAGCRSSNSAPTRSSACTGSRSIVVGGSAGPSRSCSCTWRRRARARAAYRDRRHPRRPACRHRCCGCRRPRAVGKIAEQRWRRNADLAAPARSTAGSRKRRHCRLRSIGAGARRDLPTGGFWACPSWRLGTSRRRPTPEPGASPLEGSRQRARLRKVVIVNTSDEGGGAERMSMSTLDGFAALGIDTWLLVGDKKTEHPRVMPFFRSPFFDYRASRHGLPPDRAPARRRDVERWLGREDFNHPYSHRILELTGSPPGPRVVPQSPRWILRLAGASRRSSRRVPVVLRLCDSWLFTGHCAYPQSAARAGRPVAASVPI